MRTGRFIFFFFNDTATTEIYTLSLHDALPISGRSPQSMRNTVVLPAPLGPRRPKTSPRRTSKLTWSTDRKSTRLNSSHSQISYAVFCLKKKKEVSHRLPTPAAADCTPPDSTHR